MPNFKFKNRGVALLIVLGTIFIVVLLANIALNLMVSQTRFTQHKVGRIQAEYVAWAAINFANEMLRIGPTAGGWNVGSCPAPPAVPPPACMLTDPGNFPNSIVDVRIIFTNPGVGVCAAPVGCFCVSAQVRYTNPDPS
jgi:hypothetical protein